MYLNNYKSEFIPDYNLHSVFCDPRIHSEQKNSFRFPSGLNSDRNIQDRLQSPLNPNLSTIFILHSNENFLLRQKATNCGFRSDFRLSCMLQDSQKCTHFYKSCQGLHPLEPRSKYNPIKVGIVFAYGAVAL